MVRKDISVDEFVKTRVLPKYQPIVWSLRKLLRGYAPEVKEIMSYGIPSYRRKRIIAVISPAKTHITLAFSQGKAFKDKYGLLEGVGKVSMNVRFKDVKDINETALRYYIKQALAFDNE